MVTIGLSRTVSEINGDIRRKSPIFPHPRVFNAHAEGVPLEFGIGARGPKCFYDGLPDGRKNFKIGFVVLIQYELWQRAITQPRCRSKDAAYYVAQSIMRANTKCISLQKYN